MDTENISSTSGTTSPSLRRSTRISLTQAEHVRYDTKYHPLDEAIRPKTAAKRRSVYGAPPPKELGSDIDVDNEADSDQTLDATDSDSGTEAEVDGQEEEQEVQPQHAPRSPPRGERHSSRIAAQDSPFSYSQKQHPQDPLLRSAGVIGRGFKRAAPTSRFKPIAVTRRRASTGSVLSKIDSSKKRKRHSDDRGATLAKTKSMTNDDYATVYTQAWELVGQTKQERSFITLQHNYVNAWETLAIQSTPMETTPDEAQVISSDSESIGPDNPLCSGNAAQIPTHGSDLATSVSGVATAPSRSPNHSVLFGSPRNSSKQHHSGRRKATKPNFKIYEDSTTHAAPPSNSFMLDKDKENDSDPDTGDELSTSPSRRRDVSSDISCHHPVSSNTSAFSATRSFLDRSEPTSGQRSDARSNAIDLQGLQLTSKQSLDGAEDTQSEEDGDSSVGSDTLRQASPEL